MVISTEDKQSVGISPSALSKVAVFVTQIGHIAEKNAYSTGD
jgi:hypothetical protein